MTKIKLILAALLLSGCQQPQMVDTIIHNATIYCMDGAESVAQALAIQNGKILEVGAENQILNKYAAQEKIDANQAFIYPGLIDVNGNLLHYGLAQNQLDLAGTKSWRDVLNRVRSHIKSDTSTWIIGRGWNENAWHNKAYPDVNALDSLFPNKHVVLIHANDDALIASTSVVNRAGMEHHDQTKSGADILSHGVFANAAMQHIQSIIPEPTENQKRAAMQQAQTDCLSKGLTTLCGAGVSVSEVELIRSMHTTGELKMRVYAMYLASKSIMQNLVSHKIKTERLTAHAVKIDADEVLGLRNTKHLEPFADNTKRLRNLTAPHDSLIKWAKACYRDSFQLCVQGTDAKTIGTALDAIGNILEGTNDMRWRIEQAQTVNPNDYPKLGAYNIIPTTQPARLTLIAENRRHTSAKEAAYPLASLKNQNGLIALGTGFSAESINPIHTYYTAVARKSSEGQPINGFPRGESLSRIDAMRGITIWAAIANFEEKQKGSIEAGKVADLVILNQDIITCPEDNILSTKVLETWINGEQLYKY